MDELFLRRTSVPFPPSEVLRLPNTRPAWQSTESGHGMVIFSSAWTPATLKKGGVRSAPTDRPRPRARYRPGCFARLHSRCCGPVSMAPGRRCRGPIGYRDLETLACATPHWVGMRVSFWDLTTWSWLMASAHGAGLMVVPVLLGGKSVFCGAVPSSAKSLLSFHPLIVASAVGVHTISHLVIAGVVAWIVYDFIGWRCCVAHGSILI
jgi:hypothetical protein